ncbi:MAG: tyrosine--tRNA ligase [Patescibacteria group bacterium]
MDKLDCLLNRNVSEVIPSKDEFRGRLLKDPVKIYFGIDPTGAEIHLGHAVILWKLHEFQELGHKVVLLVGDFTARIGDPTGKDETRRPLTEKEISENSKTYKRQVGKILDLKKTEFQQNSKWLNKIFLKDLINITSKISLQQLLHREMFQKRIKSDKSVALHEFIYPLLQGYDSVAMNVDCEIGGTDQTFNMLIGRILMRKFLNKEKFIITVPLLEGIDGRKMSKSFNNYISVLDSPQEMQEKVTRLKDDLIMKYFRLATRVSNEKIVEFESSLEKRELSFQEAKEILSEEIINLYHF